MRNLKKILALVLALMMVLSVMVTSSAAFEDADEIQHTEAVEVMSNLGILLGDGTNFNPNGTLTRAQAAVIIAKMLEGSVDNISVLVDAVDNPFTDVPAWALDYVLYAYSKGVVRGTSADKYTPNKNLTGYEFGKMVLVAAGICKDADFNNNWKMVVADKLSKTGLMAGLTDLVLSKDLSREHAAQMAFNAMNYATTSNYGYPVYEIATSDILGFYPTIIEAATAAKVLGAEYTYGKDAVKVGNDSLAAAVFGLNTFDTTEGIGFDGYKWYVDVDGIAGYNPLKDLVVSSFICTDKVVGTFTKANSWKEIATALGKKADFAATTYANGEEGAVWTIDFDSTAKCGTDSDVTLTVAIAADKTVKLLYAREYLTFAARSQNMVTTDKTSPYYGLYTWTFNAPYMNKSFEVYAPATAYTNGAAYMFVPTVGTPVITAPNAVVGKIMGVATDKYIRVDNTVYYLSDASADNGVTPDYQNSKTVYLNTAGEVIYVGGVGQAAAPVYDGHVFVTALEYVATPYSATGLVGAGSTATITAKATILTTAGESLVVDVATKIETDGYNYTPKYYLNGWKTATTDRAPHSETVGDWFAYNVVDGVYYFADKAATPASGYSNKKAEIVIGGETYYMTANTELVFYYYNTVTKGIDIFTHTGYADYNGANYINGVNAVVVANPVTNEASSITFYDYKTPVDTADYAVYAGLLEDSAYGNDYDVYGFYFNGELQTFYVAANTVASLPNVGDVVEININAYGQVVSCSTVNYNQGTDVVITAVSADGTYVIVDGNTVKYLNSYGTTVYDETQGYAVVELAAGQIISIKGNSYGAQFIMVTGYVD